MSYLMVDDAANDDGYYPSVGMDAQAFNADLSNWDVSSVTTMEGTFYYAKSFNSAIGAWDVSKVRSMYRMFTYASSFNSEIGAWDTSLVKTMSYMLYTAGSFNDPSIVAWDVQSATNFERMFYYATQFDVDISPWVFSETDYGSMTYMFSYSGFSNALCWDVGTFDTNNMFDGTTGSINTRAAKCACSIDEFYNGAVCEACVSNTTSFGKTESCVSCTDILCSPTAAPTVSPPPTATFKPTTYKTPINDETFYEALNAWFYDEEDAEVAYGHISGIIPLYSSQLSTYQLRLCIDRICFGLIWNIIICSLCIPYAYRLGCVDGH